MNKTESNWPQLVGAFITNFGAAEMAAFGWITKLSADPVVLRDLAIEMPFKKRISLVCELIVRSGLPTEQKEKASSTSIMGISSEVSPTCRLRSRAW